MKKQIKILIIAIAAIIAILLIGLIWYFASIKPVNKKNNEEVQITLPLGTGKSGIANVLKENHLIKNKTSFKLFVKLNDISNFQAGTYYLKQSMSVKEICNMLQTGIMYDPNQLNITYIEGKNIKWLAKTIADKTNNTEEDVLNKLENEEYINSLIEKYWFLTDEIKDKHIYYSLEGYLFPDTYTITNKDATVEEIFEKMLDKTEDILNDYKEDIEKSNYTVHEILTIASIIESESMSDTGRKDVSSVIYNRLNKNMAIQSDVTTYYAFKINMGERDLYQKEIDTYNPYNTRGPNMEGKLPVGPICSIGKASIESAIYPNKTDYLFFVADKNGKLYFNRTESEHSNIISTLKSQGLWLEY